MIIERIYYYWSKPDLDPGLQPYASAFEYWLRKGGQVVWPLVRTSAPGGGLGFGTPTYPMQITTPQLILTLPPNIDADEVVGYSSWTLAPYGRLVFEGMGRRVEVPVGVSPDIVTRPETDWAAFHPYQYLSGEMVGSVLVNGVPYPWALWSGKITTPPEPTAVPITEPTAVPAWGWIVLVGVVLWALSQQK